MGKPEEKQKDTVRSINDKKDPYKEIKFVKRQAKIEDKDGNIIFDEEVEFPDTFSDAAVKIVSSKYLCNNAKVKENSIRQMIDRVANTISDWGKKDGYFVNDEEYENFKYKLKYYQINQYFTFNSPIYFNVGIADKPQCSACFLLDVEDNMESIYDNIKLEAAIFKGGSGSGSNLSSLRSSKERVRGGGFACLTGDTIIINDHVLNKSGIEKGQITIEEQYKRMIRGAKYNLPKNIRCMVNDGLIGVNKIEDIICNGIRPVFMIETEHGYKIKATANHRFLSECDGWKRLDEFLENDKIAVNGKKRSFGKCKRCGREKSLFGDYSEFCGYCYDCKYAIQKGKIELNTHLQKIGECKRCGKVRLLRGPKSKHCGFCNSCAGNQHRALEGSEEYEIMKKNRNIKIAKIKQSDDYINHMREINIGENSPSWKGDNASPGHAKTRWMSLYPELKDITICEKCGIEGRRIEVHHNDENVYNNDRENLKVLCVNCHQGEHVRRRAKYIPHKQKEITFDKIIKIVSIGNEEVYDIQMKEPYHNFIANGFVSHNSGAVSFLKAADTSAGVIRSGGTLRRSAKLVCIDDIYPDIQKFIHCKENEELKLHMLKESGFVNSDGYEMSDEVFFQNTNISVRLSDEFMEQVEKDGEWWTKYVLTGERCEKFKARNLLKEISEIAWKTADPGVQFSGNINRWNTCANSGEIKTSNPCSEFLAAPGNLSCNLASINLRKFFYKNNKGDIIFDTKRFKDIVQTIITAQDIIVDNSSYPSRKITKNSHMFRPLGLGYSNLGALLMWLGLSYDSDDGRNIAGLITALLTGIAYDTSNILADKQGSFEKFEENKKPFYKVLNQHYDNQKKLIDNTSTIISDKKNIINQISKDVIKIWDDIKSKIDDNRGFRNSQATLLAPTGTTSFMMDCDTFGVEPDYSLIKYKTLSGNKGAIIKTVNNSVREALENLQYSEYDTGRIIEELCSEGHLENSNVLNKNHISIFDTASIPNNGKRCIDYMGHIRMLESVQPFLSGAISKTVNLPSTVTVDDIYKLYLEAWKRGLKGVTVYRDGSKVYQPLRNEKDIKKNIRNECKKCEECEPFRLKLPEERDASIHKFSIGTVEGYLTVGKYPSGKIGEIFLTVSKQGSTLSGLLDSLAIMVSTCLQYGVPLRDIVSKLMYSRFEPAGLTRNKDIRFATSIVDYLARYLGNKFLSENDKLSLGLIKEIEEEKQEDKIEMNNITSDDSAPICDVCGELMQRVGSCFNCNNCGANSGACG